MKVTYVYINQSKLFKSDKLKMNKEYINGEGCRVYGSLTSVKVLENLLTKDNIENVLEYRLQLKPTHKTKTEIIKEINVLLNDR